MRTLLCHQCGFAVRRGHIPIIWPGTARTALYCSLDCAEKAGVQMHPLQSKLHRAAEKTVPR